MPVTPLVPSLPPLAAALALDALLTLLLGLGRTQLFAGHDLGTRLVGAAHLALAYGTLILARAVARYTRLLVARLAALSLVATAATLLLGAEVTGTLDAAYGGPPREAAHAALLGAVAAWAWLTSPARRPLRSESPT
ncbi:MAG: hypothetical protein U0325_02455 [Polyangiales bacterium]